MKPYVDCTMEQDRGADSSRRQTSRLDTHDLYLLDYSIHKARVKHSATTPTVEYAGCLPQGKETGSGQQAAPSTMREPFHQRAGRKVRRGVSS